MSGRNRACLTPALMALTLTSGVQAVAAPSGQMRDSTSMEWPTYGHDAGGARFSPLTQITPGNVKSLKPAWTYHMKPAVSAATAAAPGVADEAPPAAPGAPPSPFAPAGTPGLRSSEATPIIVNGIMYIPTPYGRVVALNPMTGNELWVYTLPAGNASTRGVTYFPGDKITPPSIVVAASNRKLFILDAKTGALNETFGDKGTVALDKVSTSAPVTYKNLIILSGQLGEGTGPGAPGDVSAYDIHDGKRIWTFHTIPQPGEPNYGKGWVEASAKGRSGVNAWAPMTVDVDRGIVFLPLGAPSGDLFGGDRPGDNLYSSSLVALDAATGKYLWHFQLVHHDVWDYDVSEPPALFDIKKGGKSVPVVVAMGKNGLLFILDRTTGKPVFGVEERPVPQSDVPGEKLSPTQPFPLAPKALSRNSMTANDITTVTPEIEAACRKFVADNNIMLDRPAFAPNAYNRSAAVFPSEIGGPSWGGASFNPKLGLLFINVNELGQVIGTKDPASGPVNLQTLVGNAAGGRQGPYANFGPQGRFAVRDPVNGLTPCSPTPWGSFNAVDVNTGKIVWKVPLGVTETLPAGKQDTGRPNIAGSIATASGLLFIAGTDDRRFRAFDAKSGKELWTTKMNASGSAVPSTYQGRDGKQYVVIVATGGSNTAAPITSDEVIAYALP
jgi:quinoprotein glucose dehydrogenase